MSYVTPLRRLAIALVSTLIIGAGSAAAPLQLDAGAVPFDEGPGAVAVGLGWDGGLVISFGEGNLGDVVVPRYAADAYDCPLTRSGLIEHVGSGITFVHDTADVRSLQAAYASSLAGLGLVVQVDSESPRILHAATGDLAYRVVFSYVEGTRVLVYVGS